MRKYIRAVFRILLILLALLLLLPLLLYIPAVQSYVCQKVVNVLNDNSMGLSYGVGAVRIDFPLEVNVRQVSACHTDGDTIFYIDRLHTGLNNIPFFQDYYVINRLGIEGAQLNMSTEKQTLSMSGRIEQLDVRRISFDPSCNYLHVGALDMSGFALMMTMLPSDEPDSIEDEEDSLGWDIEVGRLNLARGEYLLGRPRSAFFLHTSFDQLEVERATVTTGPVSVQAEALKLEETMCRLDLDSTPQIPYYDYNHMDFHGVNLSATKIHYDSEHIEALLHSLSAAENNCGMQIDDLSVAFTMDSSLINAQEFRLVMPGTNLSGDVLLDYEFFSEPYPGVFSVQLAGQVAGTDVIRYTSPYVPDVALYWPGEETVQLDVNAYATSDTLRVKRFDVSMPGWVDLSATATGEHIFAGGKGRLSCSLDCELQHADSLISAFVSRPEERSYRLPDSLYVGLTGGLRSGTYYVDATFNQGRNTSLTAEGSYAYQSDRYKCTLQAEHANLGDFIPALNVKQLDASADVSGRKFDLLSNGAELDVNLQLDTLLSSPSDLLTDVRMAGTLADHRYEFILSSGDERVGLEAQTHGLISEDTLTSVGTMSVQRLQAALFTAFKDEEGYFSSDMQWSLQSDWDECHDVDFRADTLSFDTGEERWDFDNITMQFHAMSRYMSAVLNGGDCHATMQMDCGVGEFSQIIDTLTSEIDRQVEQICLNPGRIAERLPQMDFRLSMEQDNPFFPFFTYYNYAFSKVGIHFHNDRRMTLDALAIDYEDPSQHYDTINLRLNPIDTALQVVSISPSGTYSFAPATSDYEYAMDLVHTEPKLRRSYTVQAAGEVHHDSLTLHFSMVDGLQTRMYDLGASLAMADDTLTLHFMDHPIIYAQQLDVNPQNFIRVTSFKNPALQSLGVMADLAMEGPHGFTLDMQTEPDVDSHGNRLYLNIHHLDLEYLGKTVQWGNSAAGIANLDGSFFVRPDSMSGGFNLRVDSLGLDLYHADSLACNGHFENSHNQTEFLLGMAIDGRNVLIANYLDATNEDGTQQPISSNLTADHLPLALANIYMPENVPLDGYLDGRIDYTGPERGREMPNGYLRLDDASVRYADADATLCFPTDSLSVRDGRILFEKYNITAVNKNPLAVDGVVDLSEDLASPRIDLSLHGDNVTLFRSTKCVDKDQYICGTLPANINLRLRGVSPDLMLTGSVSALSGSDLQYYLQEDPLKSDSKLNDLVEFVEFSKLNKHTTSLLLKNNESVGGFGVNIRIDVARNAALDIHMSTTGDDNISVRGGGALQFSMGTDGTMRLNGTYDITDGDVSFKLPMLPVSKAFDIVDGSILRWNGEVENPELNITASEDVRCTINDESGVSRVVKFVVYVYIQGTMDDLSLSFSCAAPEDASLQNQINSLTEEERSKQAIRLLVTQSYSGPGVTTSSSMASANGAINALLQQEVESFFNQHMKNTQISVGIDTYDADGTGSARTDYSVKISQSLFNDRVRIVLGGRVSSGDEAGSNREDAIINDFSLEWLLRENGEHYLRIFRKTNYESILEGEIVETGVGYVMQRSSYRLLDLLIPSSEKRRQRMMERIKVLDLNQHALPSVDSLLKVPVDTTNLQPLPAINNNN